MRLQLFVVQRWRSGGGTAGPLSRLRARGLRALPPGRGQGPRYSPWGAGRLIGCGVGSALLASLPVGGAPISLAACVAAVCTGWELAGAAAGGLLIYLLAWQPADGLYLAALTLLLPAVNWVIGKGQNRDVPWLMPAAGTVAAGALGLGFLWQLGFSSPWTGRLFLNLLVVLGGGFVCRWALVQHRRSALYLLAAALLAALSRFSLGQWFNPGIFLALLLVIVTAWTPEGIAVAAACGTVLELACAVPLAYTAFFCLTSGTLYLLRQRTVFHRSLAALLLSAGFAWLTAHLQAQLVLLSAIAACLFALPIPRLSLWGDEEENMIARFRRQLQRSSDVLLRLHDTILLPTASRQEVDVAEVFDRAAERVCQGCVNYAVCWDQQAAQTYHALCDAAGSILERCQARAEDFPAAFVGQCQNLEQFIRVINLQLDERLYRRQLQARQQEHQQLLRDQYLLLSRFLQATADTAGLPRRAPGRFTPEVAAKAAGRGGRTLSGDRGACFHGPGERFYVLLCDGMGTGREAAAQSGDAIETLSGLLRAGMDPTSALQLLNSAYVLRDDGAFSTVDILQVDLLTGDSLLLKWGGAPSYLQRGQRLRRLGEASLPPGLGLDKSAGVQRIKLTLQEGDLLVLTSDGADRERTEQYIRDHSEQELAALAGGIIETAEADDDVTAVALRLLAA